MKISTTLWLGALSYAAIHVMVLTTAKAKAWNKALSYSQDKGIVNLGSGYARTPSATSIAESEEIVFNVDQNDAGPNIFVHNLEEPLPFWSKQFDVAFASHVLEHLENWRQAMDEWTRIADHTIIVLPNPLALTGWIHPDHKQHFSWNDMEQIRRLYPTAEVYA